MRKAFYALALLVCAAPAVAQTASVYSLPGSPSDYEVTYNGPTGVTFRQKSNGAILGLPQGVFRFTAQVWKAEGKTLVPQFGVPSVPSRTEIDAAYKAGWNAALAAAATLAKP